MIKQTSDPADRICESLDRVIPRDAFTAYDVRDVIDKLVDEGDFFEIHEEFAKNIVCGFARMGGAYRATPRSACTVLVLFECQTCVKLVFFLCQPFTRTDLIST
jgi:hypothetical protein